MRGLRWDYDLQERIYQFIVYFVSENLYSHHPRDLRRCGKKFNGYGQPLSGGTGGYQGELFSAMDRGRLSW